MKVHNVDRGSSSAAFAPHAPANHLHQQHIAGGWPRQKYGLDIRHIAALCEDIDIDQNIQFAPLEAGNLLRVSGVGTIDVVAAYPSILQLLTKADTMGGVQGKNQRLAVLIPVLHVGIRNQRIALRHTGNPLHGLRGKLPPLFDIPLFVQRNCGIKIDLGIHSLAMGG